MVAFSECWLILLTLAVISGTFYQIAPALTLVPVLLFTFTVYFFRDPERHIPSVKGVLVCPADGKVLDVEEIDDKFVGKSKRLSIFMSGFDVHVNRSPFDCKVMSIQHTPGTKIAAYLKGSLDARERNRIELTGEVNIVVEQYAGVVARRIICYVKEGQKLKIGERIGMIKFGSRVDVIAPLNVDIKVSEGDRVKAGETIIGGVND